MANKNITIHEYLDLMNQNSQYYRFDIECMSMTGIMTYRGCFLFPHRFDNNYTVFEKCDYCESSKMPIEKNHQYVCASCGAPV